VVVYALDAWDQLSILNNIGIVAGYMIVPATALRFIPVSNWVRAAGVGFFLTCAITHVYMSSTVDHHNGERTWVFWVMMVNHQVQVIALWTFLLGLSSAVRAAISTRRQRLATPGVIGDGIGDDQRSRQ
jgi:hypothetical protein